MFKLIASGLLVALVADIHAQNISTSTVTPQAPPNQIPPNQYRGSRPAIIGGEPAQEGEIPFQAALFSPLIGDPNGALCGGSLIRPNWVLTAAHCLTDTENTQVGLGGTNRNNMPYQEVSTERFIHEGYTRSPLVNDIALVKLPRNAEGQFIEVVQMAQPNQGDFAGLSVRASGFGLTSDGGQISNDLQRVDLVSITNDECATHYRQGLVTDGNICATWSTQEGQSTCEGDSGGPLSTDQNGQTLLLGVSSFVSANGCSTGAPAAFTRVSAFQDWIEQTINANP